MRQQGGGFGYGLYRWQFIFGFINNMKKRVRNLYIFFVVCITKTPSHYLLVEFNNKYGERQILNSFIMTEKLYSKVVSRSFVYL